ncbi:MAG: energy transducer TonB, partial [Pseudomonadota bacterium]|nr:energy transducer TonB [Pseudomonadota bacterium]
PVPADRAPSVLAQVAPAYPPAAFRAREEGTVLVRAEVDASGNPTNVTVARRSSSRELDRAALDAVRGWKFAPAIRDGKAVAATVEVPVEFTLDSQ